MKSSPMRLRGQLRRFLESQASSGLILMAAAVVALIVANSPLRFGYEQTLAAYVGPLSLAHWINDGLMAVFFLLVGLEIKREVVEGQLSTWSRRILPGTAALGGMAVPAVVYLAFAGAVAPDGWAIPAATDIAFALGVLALLGDRVPVSLRIFLTALAIIDDLGAVAIIAFFYTSGLSLLALGGAALVMVALVAMNRFGVRSLPLYLIGGLILWVFVLRSGIHATLAGVLLAMTIPLGKDGPAQRLEHALHLPVSFIILPIFGLANAGVSVIGLSSEALVAPVTLGVALGLLVGKLVGVFAFSMIAVGLGLADMPKGAGRWQMLGLALLCGIGFTMSLFITPLAFPGDLILQAEAKIGILAGSVASGLLGWTLLRIVGPTRTT